jgi:hypothetical protein
MRKFIFFTILLISTINAVANNTIKISPNIKMSIIDTQVIVTINANDYSDEYITVNFGKTDFALDTLTAIESDLTIHKKFTSVSYSVVDDKLDCVICIDEFGHEYLLINSKHQYELYPQHIKKIKRYIIKHTKHESKRY